MIQCHLLTQKVQSLQFGSDILKEDCSNSCSIVWELDLKKAPRPLEHLANCFSSNMGDNCNILDCTIDSLDFQCWLLAQRRRLNAKIRMWNGTKKLNWISWLRRAYNQHQSKINFYAFGFGHFALCLFMLLLVLRGRCTFRWRLNIAQQKTI